MRPPAGRRTPWHSIPEVRLSLPGTQAHRRNPRPSLVYHRRPGKTIIIGKNTKSLCQIKTAPGAVSRDSKIQVSVASSQIIKPQQAATGWNKWTLICNDEFGSPNLPSSSKRKPRNHCGYGVFMYIRSVMNWIILENLQLNDKKVIKTLRGGVVMLIYTLR